MKERGRGFYRRKSLAQAWSFAGLVCFLRIERILHIRPRNSCSGRLFWWGNRRLVKTYKNAKEALKQENDQAGKNGLLKIRDVDGRRGDMDPFNTANSALILSGIYRSIKGI